MTEEAQRSTEVREPFRSDGPAPEEPQLSIDLVKLLSTLRRGAKTIALMTIAAAILAVATSFLVTPRYTSITSFLPPGSNNTSGAAALAGQLSQIPGLATGGLLGGVKSPGDLYVGLLKSRSIASELVRKFDLMRVYKKRKESEAEKALARYTTVEAGPKDSIVTVSVTDRDPARAHDMTAAYLEALRRINGRLALTESSQRRAFFGEQLAQEKDAQADAEVELKRTQEQSGFIAPAGQTQIELQTIAQTRAQIAVRQVELSSIRQYGTEENPDIIRLKSEIADLQSQLSHLESGERGTTEGIPASKVPQLGLDYIRKERDVKYHETLFDMLARQYESARIDEAHDSPLLQVIDPASYPDTKSSPSRSLYLAGGLFAGFLVGCGWILLDEHTKSRRT